MAKSKIQTLYDVCFTVFSQQCPTSQQIQCLKTNLDKIEAADVGVDEFTVRGSSKMICGKGVSEITYIHIHECKNFSIGIFCLPAGKTIPLHDHPGMTVLSKLLYGSVHVKSYDWLNPNKPGSPPSGVATAVIDNVLNAPCEPSILFPRSGGNIHSFTAITPCAILDVIYPPYSEKSGRACTYFTDSPIPKLPGYATLEEQGVPADLVVTGAPYLGPPLKTGKRNNKM